MSKKKMLRKGFAILATLTMALGASVNVSANATYSTTTVYNLNDNKVTVRSTIDNVGDTEQVTYLAYDITKGDGLPVDGNTEESNIIYIDQKAAEAGSCFFEYTSDIDRLGKTLIKFGAKDTDVDNTVSQHIYGVEVQFNPSYGNVTVELNDEEEFDFVITPSTDCKIVSITSGGNSVDVVSGGTATYLTVSNIPEDYILIVEFGEIDYTVNVRDGERFGTPVLNMGESNTITTFSEVQVDEAIDYEYGILFSYYENPTFADFETDWTVNLAGNLNPASKTGLIKYQALGKSEDGKFAVRLIDGGSGFLGGAAGTEYYTTPYIVIGGDYEDGVSYGRSVKFN